MISRRQFGSALALTALSACTTRASKSKARVVVIGGGFGGASAAGAIQSLAPGLEVTLIEPNPTYTACPLSNLVIGDDRPIAAQRFNYQKLAARGVSVVHQLAKDVDASVRSVTLEDGNKLKYDKLIMAPGIDLVWSMPGYDANVAKDLPHAWRAGGQTTLLREQIRAMRSGGTFVMAIPEAPYRCPPGPYERASLVAHYFKRHNPRAKVLLLDAKDQFSKQSLFQDAWQSLYGDMVEWQGAASGARVVEVSGKDKTLHTDFDSVQADVANVIPPQQAGKIAQRAGVTDSSGWCPIDPSTFSSKLQPNVHVIGDAAIANAMPKSAFAANAQAKLCALQVVRALAGEAAVSSKLVNTCYSLVSPNYGISVAGVYHPDADAWQAIQGAGGVSPQKANPSVREAEAGYALDWFATITREVFG